MDVQIPLTKAQKDLMSEFYSLPLRRVFLSKRQRQQIWDAFRTSRTLPATLNLESLCPALFAELNRAVMAEGNVQSAVFSECVYAQALADQFGLTEFADSRLAPAWLSAPIRALIDSYGLVARYIYRNPDSSRMLIQAGGHAGVDGALISVLDSNVYTIEFKESKAKTSEPDLPEYGEDGLLVVPSSWSAKNPQFTTMLEEQLAARLNFFEVAGTNVHDFTPESIKSAVSDNYAGKKFADVICTEDSASFLTMIPSNQAGLWADIRGEIRPAGRNPYRVWTPDRCMSELKARGGIVDDAGVVHIAVDRLQPTAPRGGRGISRYKITPLFFVRAANVTIECGVAAFEQRAVQQLRPTISAHMFFQELSAQTVKEYYFGGV